MEFMESRDPTFGIVVTLDTPENAMILADVVDDTEISMREPLILAYVTRVSAPINQYLATELGSELNAGINATTAFDSTAEFWFGYHTEQYREWFRKPNANLKEFSDKVTTLKQYLTGEINYLRLKKNFHPSDHITSFDHDYSIAVYEVIIPKFTTLLNYLNKSQILERIKPWL